MNLDFESLPPEQIHLKRIEYATPDQPYVFWGQVNVPSVFNPLHKYHGRLIEVTVTSSRVLKVGDWVPVRFLDADQRAYIWFASISWPLPDAVVAQVVPEHVHE